MAVLNGASVGGGQLTALDGCAGILLGFNGMGVEETEIDGWNKKVQGQA